MDRLYLLPESSSLQVTVPRRALKSATPGPMGRYKATNLREPFIVKCQWKLTPEEYKVWFDFLNKHKAIPFLLELIVEKFVYADYKCTFDGSFKMTMQGESHTVDQNVLAEKVRA